MTRPLLTIITRTCRRPQGLYRTIRSVLAQTCKDWQQIFIVDKIGRHEEGNILWANKQFEANAHRVDGEYVFPLDDDGILIDTEFVCELGRVANEWNRPEAVLVKTITLGAEWRTVTLPRPEIWDLDWEAGKRPKAWAGNGYCIVTRADIWRANVEAYHLHGMKSGGDWHYCTSLIESGCQFVRLDLVAARSLSRGRGRKFESTCTPDWFDRIVVTFGIQSVGKDDWRLVG